MLPRLSSALLAVALSAAIVVPAQAAWRVDSAQSTFSFVTTKAPKAGSVAVDEVQSFKSVSGTVSDDGSVRFAVDLASVETNVPLRNQRLKDMLFDVANHPEAVFSASTSLDTVKKLHLGQVMDLDLAGQLTIAGQARAVTLPVRIVGLRAGGALVSSRVPVVVKLSDYGLGAGVEALRAVMGLDVLSDSAPVSFSVTLVRTKM
jgi:polyisoprenoid-binding protein YceI